ncbi:MAG TPA: carboxypeptidase-like regulatory domain-containing protein [Blastocatellia bacterium]|nr:carboxypeptidase-like regulatory domain-containing protein [Blastocatellia bacterium]
MGRKTDLYHLQIPIPCPADWEQMMGNERKRYCVECDKFVYNLSQMTERQAKALLAASRGNLCARFTRDPDGSILFLAEEPPPGLRLISRRASPVATAVVTAIIGLSGNAIARPRSLDAPITRTAGEGTKKDARPEMPGQSGWLIGTIKDPMGAVIAGAAVTLTSDSTGEIQSVTSSDEGQYRFAVTGGGSYTLKVESPGFKWSEVTGLTLLANEEKRLDVTMEAGQVTSGFVVASPEPLRELVEDYVLIVIGDVGESVKVKTEGETALMKTAVTVSALLKGKTKRSAISVYNYVYEGNADVVENPFQPGNRLLLFLKPRLSDDGKRRLDGYETGWQEYTVKKLPDADLGLYRQRIEELIALLKSETTAAKDIVEWLVRCAEDPATRWEGAYELALSAELLEDSREEAEEGGEATERVGSEDRSANFINIADDEDFRNVAITLLTGAQKERLAKALLSISTAQLTEGDIQLIRLVSHFDDARLAPFLVSHLRRVESDPPPEAARIVAIFADLLKDEQLSRLADDYSENASYEDREVAEESAEEIVEAEAEEKIEEAEDAEASEEPGEEVEAEDAETPAEPSEEKLAPKEARRRRSEMLKRFLDLAERKIQQ